MKHPIVMDNFTDLFDSLLHNCGSIDVAEAEFKRMIADDADLRADYRQWCLETGHTERCGFMDYADEYLDSQDSVWDSLTDYDSQ